MQARWIWLVALGLYGVFTLWYVNWSGPVSPEEVDAYLARAESSPEVIGAERIAVIREFLENDDGREFFMANLARLPPEPVPDPVTGQPRPAPEVLREYTGSFMPALFRRAGHPAFFGRTAGGYIEHWGVEPDPGWSFVGVIRYRSRRDLMELATNPSFAPAHAYKLVAMSHTLAFPVAPAVTILGPRLWVGLLLALLAALAHLLLGPRSARP